MCCVFNSIAGLHWNPRVALPLQALDLQRSISARHLSLGSRPSQDSLHAAEGACGHD